MTRHAGGWGLLAGLVASALGCGSETGIAATPSSTPSPAPVARAWRWATLASQTTAQPEPRAQGAAIYDPVEGRLVVFGGRAAEGLLADTWAFTLETRSWARLSTQGPTPEPRLGANAVYDPGAHQMVVWAGQLGARFFDDTWALDLRTLTWRDLSPSQRPAARYGSASVFDPAERRLVQFGGFTSFLRRFDDSQGFDLDTGSWENLTPPDLRPSVRCLHTAALDESGRRMLVYGGQQSGPLDDLWSFDLGTRRWTEVTPATKPAGRLQSASFFGRDGRFFVFGGSTDSGRVNETWAFRPSDTSWLRLELGGAPSPREAVQAAYDAEGERLLVFGGDTDGGLANDVWELALTAR